MSRTKHLSSTNWIIVNLFGLTLLLTISLGTLGLINAACLYFLDNRYSQSMENQLEKFETAQTLASQQFELNRLCSNSLLQGGPSPSERNSRRDQLIKSQTKTLAKLIKISQNQESENKVEALAAETRYYQQCIIEFSRILDSKGMADANQYRVLNIRPSLEKINDLRGDLFAAYSHESQSLNATLTTSTWHSTYLCLILASWPFIIVIAGIVWFLFLLVHTMVSIQPEEEMPPSL